MRGIMSPRSLNERDFLGQKCRIPVDRHRKLLSVGRVVWVIVNKRKGLNTWKKPGRNVHPACEESENNFLSMRLRFGQFTVDKRPIIYALCFFDIRPVISEIEPHDTGVVEDLIWKTSLFH